MEVSVSYQDAETNEYQAGHVALHYCIYTASIYGLLKVYSLAISPPAHCETVADTHYMMILMMKLVVF
ncbi:hypothetical protein BDW60DRAFT_196873 [Aspergillus nidulans var. acristatus]